MLYDFRCEECRAIFEVRRTLSAEGPEKCPKCASLKTRKVILQTPQINVGWKRALGLGHSGQLSMSPVKRKTFKRGVRQGAQYGKV
jgi:putative FmdB family regulatory protein